MQITPPPTLPTIRHPDEKIIIARFGAPHGIGGVLRLRVFSRDPSFFLSQPSWWCRRRDDDDWRLLEVRDCRMAAAHCLVRMEGVNSRNDAEAWCNGDVALLRSSFPETEDRFYWCDLIGLRVLTLQDEVLGAVTDVIDIGAHDVLKVGAGNDKEILIPFVAAYVREVCPQDGVVRVDWQKEW